MLDEAELAQLLAHLKGHWLYIPTLFAAYSTSDSFLMLSAGFGRPARACYSAACLAPALAPSFLSRSMAASAMGVPGPKIALAPAS